MTMNIMSSSRIMEPLNNQPQESPIKKRRGSWALLADMAADMVNSLEFGDNDLAGEPTASDCNNQPPASNSKNTDTWDLRSSKKAIMDNNMLPAMNNDRGGASQSVIVPTKSARRRGSETLMSLFGGEGDSDEFLDYDPSSVCLKAQAKQQQTASSSSYRPKRFASMTLPARNNKVMSNKAGTVKRDPLMEFHEKHNKAQTEYKKQQDAKKRREQLRDYDDDKSMASGNSFFDFLTKAGAADELMPEPDHVKSRRSSDNGAVGGGEGAATTKMKRNSSSNSMVSFFSLFGDDEDEIAKLSSSGHKLKKTSASNNSARSREEEHTLQAAVKQSKSVKGYRVYKRGLQAAQDQDYKKAVAYYHIALVKQREYYGEDHVQTSNTLNALGLALMGLGEHFGALTALEEALHIRQELLGAGAEEVAETTSNIWMMLKGSQGGG